MHRHTNWFAGLATIAFALAAVFAASATARPLASAPTITGFTPSHALVGATVTVSGTNLTGAEQVLFNNMAATNIAVNADGTQLTATVNSETADGAALISVVTPGGTATSTQNFTVDPPTGAPAQTGKATTKMKPVILSFAPLRGKVGSKLTIRGVNFGGATSVKLAGVKALFKVPNAKEIVVTVPKKAHSGAITVATQIGSATKSLHFIVIAA